MSIRVGICRLTHWSSLMFGEPILEHIVCYFFLKVFQRGILHDPSVYPNPSKFEPERYFTDGKLDFTGRDPASAVFGFGRR